MEKCFLNEELSPFSSLSSSLQLSIIRALQTDQHVLFGGEGKPWLKVAAGRGAMITLHGVYRIPEWHIEPWGPVKASSFLGSTLSTNLTYRTFDLQGVDAHGVNLVNSEGDDFHCPFGELARDYRFAVDDAVCGDVVYGALK